MASCSSLLSEDLQCSVCLEVFTDPVTTPCGHNFCKNCLKTSWENTHHYQCPLCKETFYKKPNLKINTSFRDIAEQFKKITCNSLTEKIRCDVCKHRKAIKSCLDCCGTFCDVHLEPHYSIPLLKKHKLINPVENLQDYICQKHERPLEMFCRDDQTYLCLLCARDHMTHNTVPIEQKTGERKNQLRRAQEKLQKMIQSRTQKIQEIKHSLDLRKKNTEKEKIDCVELFTTLIHCIERCQSDLLEVMEQKQKAAETHAEDLIKELEQEIAELKMRDTELENLSHTQNHIHLLHSSLYSPLNSRNWTRISFNTHQSMKTMWKALVQLQETLNEKLNDTVLKGMQQYAVDVTLDPDTAHHELILSHDGKQVRHENIKQNLPDNPERFDDCLSVLGKEGFSTGRFYYEVHVTGKTKWNLGVVRESINRKGDVIMSPENGYWVLCLRDGGDYWVVANPSVFLSLRVKPQKVGVFVDYEEGLVSFYDVDSGSHIYLYTGQSFSDKLLPYFCPCNNDEGANFSPMIIPPIKHLK